jgi:hypothetical protein
MFSRTVPGKIHGYEWVKMAGFTTRGAVLMHRNNVKETKNHISAVLSGGRQRVHAQISAKASSTLEKADVPLQQQLA